MGGSKKRYGRWRHKEDLKEEEEEEELAVAKSAKMVEKEENAVRESYDKERKGPWLLPWTDPYPGGRGKSAARIGAAGALCFSLLVTLPWLSPGWMWFLHVFVVVPWLALRVCI